MKTAIPVVIVLLMLATGLSAQTSCAVGVDLRWRLSDAVVNRMTGDPLPDGYVAAYNLAQNRFGKIWWQETARDKYSDVCLDAEHAAYFIVWHEMAPHGVMVDVYQKSDSGCVVIRPGNFSLSVIKHARNQERSAKQAFKEALMFITTHGRQSAPSGLSCVPPEIVENPAELRRQLELRSEQQLQASTTSNPGTGSPEAVLDIFSVPPNADIELDGNFVGNTPSSVTVPVGEHKLRITKGGHKAWERKINALTGKIRISAELEEAPGKP